MKKRGIAALLAGVMIASLALTGCGDKPMDKDAVALKVGDEEITLGFLNFMARYQQACYDDLYVMYLGEDAWETDPDGDGLTLEESTKAEVLEMVQGWYVLEAMQEQYDVVVPDSFEGTIKDTAAQFMADNTPEALEQMGATQEYVETMLYYRTLEALMMTAIEAEAQVTVTDEEAAQRSLSYILLSNKGANTESGTYELFDEAELEEVRAQAQKKVVEAKADFDKLAEELGYTGMTYSYSPDDNYMDPAIIEAANALDEGEVSDLIEGMNGFFVIRLDSIHDETASETNKLILLAEKRQAYYQEVLKKAIEAAQITVDEKLWAQVTFDSLFTVKTEEETDATTEETETSATAE